MCWLTLRNSGFELFVVEGIELSIVVEPPKVLRYFSKAQTSTNAEWRYLSKYPEVEMSFKRF
jgi:hypothetical protein